MKAQGILGQYVLFIGSALLATAGIPEAFAQTNPPLTGKLLQGPVPAAANPSAPATQPAAVSAVATLPATAAAPVQAPETPASVPAAREARVRIGDVTHILLQAQADGRVAGPRLPMLGATADASWQRYLDSFKHPLPEFYEIKVTKSPSN